MLRQNKQKKILKEISAKLYEYFMGWNNLKK